MEILTPKLRFPEFKDNPTYKNYSFKDVFLFSTGKNIKQTEASPEFQIPCVRYGELYHMYNEVIHEIINKTNLNKSELLFSYGDEILLPSAGEDPLDIGSASALTLKDIAIGRTINILRPIKSDIYSPIYASYYINQKLRKKISTLAKGSSISNVYNSDLKKLKIVLPELFEQQKIASFLTDVDDKITKLTKKKDLLEQYKKGVMQKIFNQELRFKDDNGNAFPDWEVKLLEELCDLKNGYAFKSSTYVSEGSYSIVTIKNVQDGLMVNNFNKLNKLPSNLETHQVLDLEDILISMTGNVGRVCKVTFKNCVLNQRVGKIIPKNVDKNYLYFILNYRAFLVKMENSGQGAAQMNIGKKDVLSYKSKFATSIEEQTKIANFLSDIDIKIEALNTKIENSKTFKRGLLQQIFV